MLVCAALFWGNCLRLRDEKAAQNTTLQNQTIVVKEVPVEENDESKEEAGALTNMEIARRVKNSIVGVACFKANEATPFSSGSGIVITKNGYIATNAHVIAGAKDIVVTLTDGSEYKATIKGSDTRTDIAVLQINAGDLKVAEFGDSDMAELGERVVAIGNPGGLSGSLSQGVISGTNRQIAISSSGETMNLLQTDAAINPGNSGGALINRFGQIIGICSAKISALDYEGIGFAIPIKEAQPIITALVEHGYVKGRASLGVMVYPVTAAVAKTLNLPEKGLYIVAVTEGSSLAAQGVRDGDILLKAGKTELVHSTDLLDELKKYTPGQSIDLKIYFAATGKTRTLSVKLIEATE